MFIIIVIGIGFFYFSKEETDKVCIKENCFNVQIADTPIEREKGLMFREEIGQKEGMLFIFQSSGNYPFWMKNTLIPLDIIWINKDGVILDIREAEPCKTDPCPIINHQGSALYVLEIKKGISQELGIHVGDIAISSKIGNI
jgi:uncharacterized membrane protein (UPF0127 family)